MLKDLSDIKIDVPDAVDSVAKFLARAVADGYARDHGDAERPEQLARDVCARQGYLG